MEYDPVVENVENVPVDFCWFSFWTCWSLGMGLQDIRKGILVLQTRHKTIDILLTARLVHLFTQPGARTITLLDYTKLLDNIDIWNFVHFININFLKF